ncbi:MAG: hypothetical protein U1U88_001106 [Lawsonella clevelandensis]
MSSRLPLLPPTGVLAMTLPNKTCLGILPHPGLLSRLLVVGSHLLETPPVLLGVLVGKGLPRGFFRIPQPPRYPHSRGQVRLPIRILLPGHMG